MLGSSYLHMAPPRNRATRTSRSCAPVMYAAAVAARSEPRPAAEPFGYKTAGC